MTSKHLRRLEKLNTTECLWVYILKILSKGPSHAYVLRKQIEHEFGFRPGTVTAYRVLYDLQKLGLVKKHKEGMKRIYQITSVGKSDLKRAAHYYKQLGEKLGK
jgi:DNA-binding PadR family transcriptional regulator